MKLTIGFSPCPNDTFIFDALINQKMDTGGLSFDVVMEDVETLNLWALEGKLDITKLSLPAFFRSLNHYSLLNAGSALGKGVGPLLISNKPTTIEQFKVNKPLVAIPGLNTTANLLFDFAFPENENKIFMKYDEIENFIVKESSKAPPTGGGLEGAFGVIIHENRFTYQQNGLYKILDLGEYWETKMNVPIPLGSIAIKKSVDKLICLQVDALIRKSLEFAFSNYPLIPDFVKDNAQEMEEDIMRKHIDLYVNNFSLDLGDSGKNAIEILYSVFLKKTSSSKSTRSSSLFSS